MHNLVKIKHTEAQLALASDADTVTQVTIDYDNNVIYSITQELSLLCLKSQTGEIIWSSNIRSKAEDAGTFLPLDTTVTAFAHVPELQALWFAFSTGELILLHQQDHQSGDRWSLEEVGTIEGGIAAAGWSPDGQILAVISGTHQLLLMSSNWDLIAEVSMNEETPVKPQPQAAVQSASSAPQQQQTTLVDANTATQRQTNGSGEEMWHSSNSGLSWRGDGQFLATCTPFNGVERIKIWGRDGAELHALGETAVGLQPTLAWQPNCRHLYAAQIRQPTSLEEVSIKQLEDEDIMQSFKPEEAGAQGQAPQVRHVGAWKRELRRQRAAAAAAGAAASANRIILYERNGLQHGGFDVPGDGVLEQLLWSPDSEYLVVVLKSISTTTNGRGSRPQQNVDDDDDDEEEETEQRHLQIWHRSNWHWYLKQERFYTHCQGLSVNWEESGLGLHAVSAEGNYTYTQYTTDVCSCSSGTVAVVDGGQVLVTAMRVTVVPPPMCSVAIECSAPVNCIGFRDYPDECSEAIAAFLSNGLLCISTATADDLWEETLEQQLEHTPWDRISQPKLLPIVLTAALKTVTDSDTTTSTITAPRLTAWTSPTSLLAISSSLHGDTLIEIHIHGMDSNLNLSSTDTGGITGTGTGSTGVRAEVVATVVAPAAIVSCVSCSGGYGALMQSADGGVWQYTNGGSIERLANSSFPTVCVKMLPTPNIQQQQGNGGTTTNINTIAESTSQYDSEWGIVPSSSLAGGDTGIDTLYNNKNTSGSGTTTTHLTIYQQQGMAFGLTADGKLYWDRSLIAIQVTSFTLRFEGPGGAFLLYTTRGHVLCTLALSTLHTLVVKNSNREESEMMVKGIAGIPTICLRVTEEGAVAVSAPADGVSVVLQAPRGNLEIVRPRALVIPAVTEALEQQNFTEAWQLATVNRLDMNILVDYQWPSFLDTADKFVDKIGSDQDIADLLASLQPGSTTGVGGSYTAALVGGNSGGGDGQNGASSAHTAALELNFLQLSNLPAGSGNRGNRSTSHVVSLGTTNGTGGTTGTAEQKQGCGGGDFENNKVHQVCAAVRAAIQNKQGTDRRRWLQSELTTYSKCGDLPAAMVLVKEAKEADLLATSSTNTGTSTIDTDMYTNGNNTTATASSIMHSESAISIADATSSDVNNISKQGRLPTAEDGLKHLLLHCLEEDVYRAALGSYELELSYMVVTHSQRDPGEYLLDLQRFAAIPDTNLRHHAIDIHLRRYDSALKHLVNAGDDHFSEALQLAKDKNLLRLLLQLVEGKESFRREVLCACGDELEKKGKHEDAALAYVAAEEGEKALRVYRVAGQWRPALVLAVQLGRDEERIKAMAARMASDLEDSHRHAEAAMLTLDYLNNIPEAVRLNAAGGEWREAMRIACYKARQDLITDVIVPAARAACDSLMEQTEEDVAKVEKYVSRLKELRGKRAAMHAAISLADENSDLPARHDFDAESEAASIVTGLSLYTQNTHLGGTTATGSSRAASTIGGRGAVSAKKAKKLAKKKNKVRQGSPEEEAAIARHIMTLAPSSSVCSSAGQLIEALCMLGYEPAASKLQHTLARLISTQQEAVKEVLTHPPPGLSLSLDALGVNLFHLPVLKAVAGQSEALFRAIEGAVEDSLKGLPGNELSVKAGEIEAGLKSVHWKWDIFRDA